MASAALVPGVASAALVPGMATARVATTIHENEKGRRGIVVATLAVAMPPYFKQLGNSLV